MIDRIGKVIGQVIGTVIGVGLAAILMIALAKAAMCLLQGSSC